MAENLKPYWCPLKGHWKHDCRLERCKKCKHTFDWCTRKWVYCPKYDELEGEKK